MPLPLPEFVRDATRALLGLVAAHQYIALFSVVAIEEAGIPLPVPTDVVIAYYGHRARGDLAELAQVVLVCALASTVGTLVPYGLARRFGMLVIERLGPLFDIDPAGVERWSARAQRYGFLAIFVARLIPGARVVTSIVGGTAGVPLREFSAAVFLAACIYWSIWVGIGLIFGPVAERVIGPAYVRYIFFALPLVFVTFFGYRFWRHRRRQAAARRP